MKRFKRILTILPEELPTEGVSGWLDCLATHAEAEGVDLLAFRPEVLAEYPAFTRGDAEGGDEVVEFGRRVAEALTSHPTELIETSEDPLKATLRRLATGEYDLVVLPVGDGRTRSLAERLARKSPVGVLILPEVAPVPPKRILAALDFSEFTGLIIDWTEAFGTLHGSGAELEAVHVLDQQVPTRATLIRDGERIQQDIREAADFQMHSQLDKHARNCSRWRHRFVDAPLPGFALAELVASEADLLVIGCQGRNALSIALLGSTTADVIRSTERPVLVVRQKNQNLSFLRELIGWDR